MDEIYQTFNLQNFLFDFLKSYIWRLNNAANQCCNQIKTMKRNSKKHLQQSDLSSLEPNKIKKNK